MRRTIEDGGPAASAVTRRLAAEWEPQDTMWFVWPRDETTWPGGRIQSARAAYQKAIEAVAAGQDVDLIAHPALADRVRERLAGHDRIRFHAMEHVDSWIRDYGPVYVLEDGARRALDFRFNAWGEKYPTLRADDAVVGRLGPEAIGAPIERIPMVLEGGSIDTDGQGTLLTTRECLLEPFRNPRMDPGAIEAELQRRLGAKKVLWLGQGMRGDDTDGHIDTITRFVAPGKVVTAVAPRDHPDHAALAANREALESMTDARGRPLEVIDLPLPPAMATHDGEPLPAGHLNFTIANEVVLVPTYGGASDGVVLDAVAGLLPGREVVAIDHTDLIWGMGGIHCLSLHRPA